MHTSATYHRLATLHKHDLTWQRLFANPLVAWVWPIRARPALPRAAAASAVEVSLELMVRLVGDAKATAAGSVEFQGAVACLFPMWCREDCVLWGVVYLRDDEDAWPGIAVKDQGSIEEDSVAIKMTELEGVRHFLG